MIIGGIDMSLTSTGIAILTDNRLIETCLVKSKGKKDDSLKQRFDRQTSMTREILRNVVQCDLVAIEGLFSAGQVGGSQIDRCGLWWRIVGCLFSHGVPVITVAPTQVKKFATNNGKADKGAMVLAMQRLYPGWTPESPSSTEDEADALALAAVGQCVAASKNLDPWALPATAYRETMVGSIIMAQPFEFAA